MKCRQIRARLALCADLSLHALDAQAQAHLSDCPGCRGWYEQQAKLSDLLAKAQLDPPSTIWRNIELRLSEHPAPHWRATFGDILDMLYRPELRYAVLGLLLLVIFSLGLLEVGQTRRTDEQVLAKLGTYELKVSGNPFMSDVAPENPFMDFDPGGDGNPFAPAGSSR